MEANEPILVGPQGRELEMSRAQLARLENPAAATAEPGFSPSAGQVANVLVGWALDQLGPDAIKKLTEDVKASEKPEA